MSDYERNKVVRIPAEKILQRKDGEDSFAYYARCNSIISNLNTKEKENFEFNSTWDYKKNQQFDYFDFVVYHSYSEGCNDWGKSSYLTEENFEKYVPIFSQLCESFDKNDLRKVDYCYYNGCDIPNYYEIENKEDGF